MSFLFLIILFISPFAGAMFAINSGKYDEKKLKLLLSPLLF
jgi:hypothetical protein